MDNDSLAVRLREAASLLRLQGANPFRVSAYAGAASTLEELPREASGILAREGIEGLVALPSIGRGIAGVIRVLLHTGRWPLLESLRGESEAENLFRALPGVGPELAQRLHDSLGVETPEGLELVAESGRLEEVPGIGPRRAAAIRLGLSSLLGRSFPSAPRGSREPGVDLLLEVDREYRRRAEAGELQRIAPRRFNPDNEAWLPVLHDERAGWHFTALFSNTANAHRLGRTRDWVVLYFHHDHHRERQHTVVTETSGPLRSKRVVRGREAECQAYYAGLEDRTPDGAGKGATDAL